MFRDLATFRTLTCLVGGFDPHIDANAYTHVKNIKHLTILAAVDEMNAANGGLEVVDGSHCMEIPLGSDRCIASDWVESNVWSPAELESGMQIAINKRKSLELSRYLG
jgi:ectoine hydroxylase-related dioxygenase (phytanoyl-CoA dioxygenase family)